jgi:WD40 repeat protein
VTMSDEPRTLVLPEAENRLALVIGVNRASGAQTPQLRTTLQANNDAEAMAKVLKEACGFAEVRLLLGEEATSERVKKEVLSLARKRTEHDFLLLYFAGHGHPMTVSAEEQDIYLVTHDFSEQEVEEDESLHCSMGWLRDKLYMPTAAGKVLLILDCCYAGNMGRTAPDPYLEKLKDRIKFYFGAPGSASGSLPGGMRQALAATGHNQTAYEQDGHGKMTGLLLEALRGNVDEVIDLENHGYISLYLVQNYLQHRMPETQRSSLSGDDAGKICILAQNERRAEELRRQRRATALINERPQTYIPLARSSSFQKRPDEFKTVTELLLGNTEPSSSLHGPSIVGLIGIGGTGKTQLAVELAFLYKDTQRFPSGILWLPVTEESYEALCYQLSELAANAEYLPLGDDVSHPENEQKRARHLCRYLASHDDALLILDNVKNIEQVLDLLPAFAGEELRCTILYTSRNPDTPPSSVRTYEVRGLTEQGAWHLLLARRDTTLLEVLAGDQGVEAQAARAICDYVERLPLALTLLRDLLQDKNLTVAHLWAEQRKRGTFDITSRTQDILQNRLFRTFEQSWHKVETNEAQRLFKLASFFPEAVPVPLWLLGIAANLPGSNTSLDPLGRARLELQRWSMIEVLPNDMIRLHPLLHEFGIYLRQGDSQSQDLRSLASTNLLSEFTNINKLEARARAKDYWGCLNDVQEALNYARLLHIEQLDLFERVAYWLARESSLLGESGWWPAQIPALFYQQLANRAVEEALTLSGSAPQSSWLHLMQRTGAEEHLLLRELRHPDAVRSVAFSPDGKYVVTACDDRIARLWDADSGQILQSFIGHNAALRQAVFSPRGNLIATCSLDNTARVWETRNGQLMQVFRGHTDFVRSVAFSPDGKYIATASEDRTTRVWDTNSGETIAYLAQLQAALSDVAFSPVDFQVMTCANDGTILLWDITSEQLIEIIQTGSGHVGRAAFSLTGKFLFTSSSDEGIALWDRTRKQIVRHYANPYKDSGLFVTQIALARNEQYVTASTNGNIALVWHLQSNKFWCTYGHKDEVYGVTFAPESTRVATASRDHTVRIWELPLVAIEEAISPEGSTIGQLQFSHDGTRLIAVTNERYVQVWDVATEQMLANRHIDDGKTWVYTVALSYDGKHGALSLSDTIFIYDIESGHISSHFDVGAITQQAQVRTLAFSPDERLLAVGTSDGGMQILDRQSGRQITALAGHNDLIRSLVFSSDGSCVVAGTFRGEILVWNAIQRTPITTLKGDTLGVAALDISRNKSLIVSGMLDGSIHLWSLPQEKLLVASKKHSEAVVCAGFSPDGRLLVSCDAIGQVLLWQVQQEKLLPVGIYMAPYQVGAIHWQDSRHVILADLGGMHYRPHFHHLAVEGFTEVEP